MRVQLLTNFFRRYLNNSHFLGKNTGENNHDRIISNRQTFQRLRDENQQQR